MHITHEDIARLERANYDALLPLAEVTPGMALTIRPDVILSSSEVFPAPDTTHACLLRATDETVGPLLQDVVAYFQNKGLPVTIYLSPACTPPDLGARLAALGFTRHEHDESWVVLDDLDAIVFRARRPDIETRPVGPDDALIFAQTFLAAFRQPAEFAPYLAEMLTPSLGLSTTFHFLAYDGDRPVGTISLITHDGYGIIGSTGILADYRQSGIAVELFHAIFTPAQENGVHTLFAQTRQDSTAERLLLANSFRRAFARQGYSLGE